MSEAHSLRRPSGVVVITPEFGPAIEADTRQCCHCGGHWVHQPGSGIVRGFCLKCNAPICGAGCAECVPFEKKLDLYEKGKLFTL